MDSFKIQKSEANQSVELTPLVIGDFQHFTFLNPSPITYMKQISTTA